MSDERVRVAFDKFNLSAEGKRRIYDKVHVKRNKRKMKFGERSMLVAAIIMAITMTTVIAYNSEIQRFVFGSSVAVEVEALADGHGWLGGIIVSSYDGEVGTVSLSPRNFRVYNPSFNLAERLGEYYRSFPFASGVYTEFIDNWNNYVKVEEVSQHAMFTIKEPSYLPNFRGELQQRVGELPMSISFVRLDEDGDVFGAILSYSTISPVGYANWDEAFTLQQWYVGLTGHFEIVTTDPITKVMLGDIPAVLVEHVIVDADNVIRPHHGADEMIQRELIWLEGGVVYSIASFEFIQGFASLSLEMKIAIAKSLQ